MLKRLCTVSLFIIILISSSLAIAKDGCGGSCITCHNLTAKEATELIKQPGVTVKSVKQAPANGLFEVLLEKEGRQGLLFIDYGKKHIIQGMMVQLPDFKPVSAHEQNLMQPKQITSLDVKSIPLQHSIVMGNPKGSRKLYVFTDPDCPYCRKGHAELKKLTTILPDAAIHVMLFPLPMHPGAYDKSRAILESKNLEMLDKVFDGKDAPAPAQESSRQAIDEIVKFANANGITGTPTMVMPDGTIQVGMRDAETLKKMLEDK